MAAQVKFGQIVWAEIADANGIRKSRPAIVVTTNDRITPDGPLEVVAITSFLPDPLPAARRPRASSVACAETPEDRLESEICRRLQLASTDQRQRY